LREEQRLRVFENKVIRKIFGAKRDEVTGEWRKLHKAELHALYSSPDIIRNIKSRRLRWAGLVARMGESRNAYRVLVGRPEGKRRLGRPRRRWEDNIKMYLREVGYDDRDWINLAQEQEFWDSDETKINLFGSDGAHRVWKKKNEADKVDNNLPNVKHGGGVIMIWGCLPSVYIFQQDNNKHTAEMNEHWLIWNVPKQLHTPPQSPDLNPIKHLWSKLKENIHKNTISSKEHLKTVVLEELRNFTPQQCKMLVNSMQRRCQAVIKAKGYATSRGFAIDYLTFALRLGKTSEKSQRGFAIGYLTFALRLGKPSEKTQRGFAIDYLTFALRLGKTSEKTQRGFAIGYLTFTLRLGKTQRGFAIDYLTFALRLGKTSENPTRIRHRLPDICLTVGENLGKNPARIRHRLPNICLTVGENLGKTQRGFAIDYLTFALRLGKTSEKNQRGFVIGYMTFALRLGKTSEKTQRGFAIDYLTFALRLGKTSEKTQRGFAIGYLTFALRLGKPSEKSQRGFAIDYLTFALRLGKTSEKTQRGNQPKRESNPRPSATPDQQASALTDRATPVTSEKLNCIFDEYDIEERLLFLPLTPCVFLKRFMPLLQQNEVEKKT
ncbi:hypothetical protein ANN_27310, partial [Periplaneta americana]